MDNNLSRYKDPAVVGYYEQQNELFSCEQALFGKYISPNRKVLDIGVGGGRTVPCLSSHAAEYVGVDYSDAMVAVCRKKYPSLKFIVADASDLNMVANEEYDAVVFSFNGIDTLSSDQSRARCFREIHRVLKPGGIFIFSSHNARVLSIWPDFRGAYGYKYIWRTLRSFFKSLVIAYRSIRSSAFYSGGGYIYDPVHGGIKMYTSIPKVMIPQLEKTGFKVIETVGHHYPAKRPDFLTPWFYYACLRL